MMQYTVKQGRSIRTGKGLAPVFLVVGENGETYCYESSEALAKAHIQRLVDADSRNEQARKDAEQRDKS